MRAAETISDGHKCGVCFQFAFKALAGCKPTALVVPAVLIASLRPALACRAHLICVHVLDLPTGVVV